MVDVVLAVELIFLFPYSPYPPEPFHTRRGERGAQWVGKKLAARHRREEGHFGAVKQRGRLIAHHLIECHAHGPATRQ